MCFLPGRSCARCLLRIVRALHQNDRDGRDGATLTTTTTHANGNGHGDRATTTTNHDDR